MFVVSRNSTLHGRFTCRGLAAFATTTVALALGACSAGITRFDTASFALSDGQGKPASARGHAAAGSPVINDAMPPARAYEDLDKPYVAGPRPRQTSTVKLANLPRLEATQPPLEPRREVWSDNRGSSSSLPALNRPEQPGHAVTVRSGDTLYGIARRHGVSIAALMSVNGLTSPSIWPGQRLELPADTQAPMINRGNSPSGRPALVPTSSPDTAPSRAAQSGGWNGRYTIRSGDSLYRIAARYGVKHRQLQRVNGIADARRLRPGMVIRVPGAQAPTAPPQRTVEAPQPRTVVATGPRVPFSAPASMAERARRSDEARPYEARPEAHPEAHPRYKHSQTGLKVLNDAPEKPVAAVVRRDLPAPTPAALGDRRGPQGKLRWPVRGRIVQGFGPRADGSHNDGVDIAVPKGTDVKAAEAGVVAYAGDEVRTYGNLVLIRHRNGWVTAYAYNDKLLVRRGDRVVRGQPIAKAGTTGNTDRPQLHFEVRIDAKPVDPVRHLETL